MKTSFTSSSKTRTQITLALALLILFAAPALLSAEEAPAVAEQAFDIQTPNRVLADAPLPTDDIGLPTVAFASDTPSHIDCERCTCVQLSTPQTTGVGSNCRRASWNAIEAARALAVCPAGSDICGPVTVERGEDCQPLSSGGYSATATAYYSCEVCVNICD